MPTYRQNPTDREQDVLENAAFEGGAPVFNDGGTKVVSKGAPQSAAERTAHGGTNIGSNAGVVMNHADNYQRFVEETQGKS